MAEHSPTGGIKIPSSGEATPEYNAVRKSYGEIKSAIIPDDFVSAAHSCGLIPTRSISSPPLDVVLKEISRDPVNYYSLQHVVTTLNVGGRFDKGIGKMKNTFQLEMRKYIPAGSSDNPKIEPENRPEVFISFSGRKVYGDSPDAYTEAKDLYANLEAQGCRPWMDERELEYGDVLAKEIFWAIKQCDFIIPIMTGGYATSLWCLRELYYAALQKDRIIPMLLEDEATIDDQKAGKWLLSIGMGQKYFKPTKEEKAAMVKSLKEKVMKMRERLLHRPPNYVKQVEDDSVRRRKKQHEENRTDTDDSGNYPHEFRPKQYVSTSCIRLSVYILLLIIGFCIGMVLIFPQWNLKSGTDGAVPPSKHEPAANIGPTNPSQEPTGTQVPSLDPNKKATVCHEIVDDDLVELAEIIGSHGSAKQWCAYLGISESTCNPLDYSHQHPNDIVLDVAQAYLRQKLNPCWEDIVHVLCRLTKNKAALKLSEKHSVSYSSQCG